jgi:hypothetical protein
MAQQKASTAETQKLAEVKRRLEAGKLTPADVKTLQKLVVNAENAVKALRAAVTE